jgi:hypothetical protein
MEIRAVATNREPAGERDTYPQGREEGNILAVLMRPPDPASPLAAGVLEGRDRSRRMVVAQIPAL